MLTPLYFCLLCDSQFATTDPATSACESLGSRRVKFSPQLQSDVYIQTSNFHQRTHAEERSISLRTGVEFTRREPHCPLDCAGGVDAILSQQHHEPWCGIVS